MEIGNGSRKLGFIGLAACVAKGMQRLIKAEIKHRQADLGEALKNRDVASAVGAVAPLSVAAWYFLANQQVKAD